MRTNTLETIQAILDLFKVEEGQPPVRLTSLQIQKKLNATAAEVDRPIDILRGNIGNNKQIRAVLYSDIAGRTGLPVPIFELGSEPDVPRTRANTIEDKEAIKAAKRNRNRAEELKLQRELDAIDNYL